MWSVYIRDNTTLSLVQTRIFTRVKLREALQVPFLRASWGVYHVKKTKKVVYMYT